VRSSGNGYALESFEPVFNQDLNGDGVIGVNTAPGFSPMGASAFLSTLGVTFPTLMAATPIWEMLLPIFGILASLRSTTPYQTVPTAVQPLSSAPTGAAPL
jgi:hypothetical protein